jgi:hypothetical protein
MDDDREAPKHWQKRADKARVEAAKMNNRGSRYVFLYTAESYDTMGELAKRRRPEMS